MRVNMEPLVILGSDYGSTSTPGYLCANAQMHMLTRVTRTLEAKPQLYVFKAGLLAEGNPPTHMQPS